MHLTCITKFTASPAPCVSILWGQNPFAQSVSRIMLAVKSQGDVKIVYKDFHIAPNL